MKKFKKFLKKFWPELLLIIGALFFSFWLTWHTFAYQQETILIASKAWSDFAAHLPLIRSFSWGQNWPPQYPLFPGPFIHYHFLFYALVGFLEKSGWRLDWALNFPSALSLIFLILVIYFLAKKLFQKRCVGFLSVIFFLFNGSLSFLEFFKDHPLSLKTPLLILQNQNFPSFGPYDGKIISAFWNLNIYTNQRHLALAFALILFVLIFVIDRKFNYRQAFFLGLLLGFMPFLHNAVFAMSLLILGVLLIFSKDKRRQLGILILTAAILGLPQIWLMQAGGGVSNFKFNPGYLIAHNLTFSNFFKYWFFNLGLALWLIPLGFFKAPPPAKKILLAFSTLFVVGNLWQFSPEMAANHKFFNLFLIVGNMFVAYLIFLVWQKKIWGKILVPILIFFLIFSGIIDFFPIKNDFFIALTDAPKNPDIKWIKENTPPQAIFLNSSFLYHPASLAGRKIFLGWPYFAWSAGYDTQTRETQREEIYTALGNDKKHICQLLKQNRLDFVALEENDDQDFVPNLVFWQNNFLEVYNNLQNGFAIYDVQKSCP